MNLSLDLRISLGGLIQQIHLTPLSRTRVACATKIMYFEASGTEMCVASTHYISNENVLKVSPE